MQWPWSKQREDDLDRELQAHLDLEAAEQRDSGLSETDARLAARRALGSGALVRERTRDAWGFVWLERGLQDLRYAWRMLRKSPAFTAVAVLSLALGIGATTAVFSLLDAVALKSLPVHHPAQLRILTWIRTSKSPVPSHSGYNVDGPQPGQTISGSFPYPALRAFTSLPQISGIVAYAAESFTVTADGASDFAHGHYVSGNYFSVLGAPTLIGRPLTPADDIPGGPRAVVLSYQYWEKRFAADPAVLGREIRVNQVPVTVAGVMPPAFQGLYPGMAVDIFVPITMVKETRAPWYSLDELDNWWVQMFCRLAPGVSDAQAEAAVRAAVTGIVRTYAPSTPETDMPRIRVMPGARGVGVFRKYWNLRLYILAGTSVLILLIACVNLANMLLARAAGRGHEIAIRLAIGAGRVRLLRQLFTESLLLACFGGALGVLLAGPLCRLLLSHANHVSLDARIDVRSLLFAAFLTVLTAVLFGIAPAFRATRVDLSPAMKAAPRNTAGGRRHSGRLLVTSQVALSVLLLVAAGLFIRTLAGLSSVDLGFRPERLLTFKTDPSRNGYKGNRLPSVYTRMKDQIAAIPGVESVGLSNIGLIEGSESDSTLYLLGRKDTSRRSSYLLTCSATFLATMHIPIVMGRDLSPADRMDAPRVAVVNQAFARMFLKGANPLGQRFVLGDRQRPDPESEAFLIVGVARDAHYESIRAGVHPTAYLPYTQQATLHQMTFAIRTVLPPLSLATAVRRAVSSVDSAIPVADLRTQEEQIRSSLATERLFASLVGFFGILAALLAAIGLYGVLAFTVARRTSEIGVRIALGARPVQVQWLIVRESLLTVLLGLAIGTPVAYLAVRVVKTMLFGVTPSDPISFASALLLLLAVTAIAAWIPARRAAAVDPMVALRSE